MEITDGVITLRTPSLADADDITEAMRKPEMSRWLLRVPQPYRREHAVEFIEIARRGERDSFVAEADGRVVAAASVTDGEIGYWVAPWAQGRGLGTRVVILLRDWARRERGLERIELLIHPSNAPSIRLAEKAGFRDTGERRVPDRGEDPPPHLVYAWSAE
jgi:RimJ/RimL family protein N-acetyltransferase